MNLKASPRSLIVDCASSDDTVERTDRLEVDHTRHGVRTINRRSTAGNRVNPADDDIGQDVDIDVAANVRNRQAATIEQDEVAVGAEAMKVDRCARTGTLTAGCFVTRDGKAGKLVQRIDQIGLAAFLDRIGTQGDNRADGGVVGTADQRAGYDDWFVGGSLFSNGIACFVSLLSERRMCCTPRRC